MKRKLFALLMSSFAIILLMGAGVEETSENAAEETASSIRTEEPSAPVEKPVDDLTQTDTGDLDPAVDGEGPSDETLAEPDPVPEDPVPEPEPAVDSTLLIDGQAAPLEASKTIVDGVTYVSLKVMSQLLEPEAVVSWDEASAAVTVTAPGLHMTAKAGQLYLVANDRYLYLPEGVQVVDGQTMVPLNTLAEIFCATVGWDAATGTVSVTSGTGVLASGGR